MNRLRVARSARVDAVAHGRNGAWRRIASTAAAALLFAAGTFTGVLAFAEATQDTPGEASVDTAGGSSKDNS